MPNNIQVKSDKTPWWGYIIWAVLFFSFLAFLFYFFFTPLPFGNPVTKEMKIYALVGLLIVVGIILYILFKSQTLAPAWKPRSNGKMIKDYVIDSTNNNISTPFELYGNEIVGGFDSTVVSNAGSQMVLKGRDRGVFNSRMREIVWEDRYKAIRHDVVNVNEQLDGFKTSKRVAGMEMIFTGKQPQIQKAPDVIERQVGNSESATDNPTNVLGSGDELNKMNEEAGM
jgi:hypothetical protein